MINSVSHYTPTSTTSWNAIPAQLPARDTVISCIVKPLFTLLGVSLIVYTAIRLVKLWRQAEEQDARDQAAQVQAAQVAGVAQRAALEHTFKIENTLGHADTLLHNIIENIKRTDLATQVNYYYEIEDNIQILTPILFDNDLISKIPNCSAILKAIATLYLCQQLNRLHQANRITFVTCQKIVKETFKSFDKLQELEMKLKGKEISADHVLTAIRNNCINIFKANSHLNL